MDIRFDGELSGAELDSVLDVLRSDVYWGRWRSRDQIRAQFESAWKVLAAHDPNTGELLGAGRISSDGISYGYIADVFVFPRHRGRGVGGGLIAHAVNDPDAADFRWMLHTADAHGLYARHGFVAHGPTYMERPSRHESPPPKQR